MRWATDGRRPHLALLAQASWVGPVPAPARLGPPCQQLLSCRQLEYQWCVSFQACRPGLLSFRVWAGDGYAGSLGNAPRATGRASPWLCGGAFSASTPFGEIVWWDLRGSDCVLPGSIQCGRGVLCGGRIVGTPGYSGCCGGRVCASFSELVLVCSIQQSVGRPC